MNEAVLENKENNSMLRAILEDLRLMRSRMDDHIDEQAGKHVSLLDRLADLRADIAGQKVRVALITAGVSLTFGALAAVVVSHLTG